MRSREGWQGESTAGLGSRAGSQANLEWGIKAWSEGSQMGVSHDLGQSTASDQPLPAGICLPTCDSLTPPAVPSWAASQVCSGNMARPGKQKPAPGRPQPAWVLTASQVPREPGSTSPHPWVGNFSRRAPCPGPSPELLRHPPGVRPSRQPCQWVSHTLPWDASWLGPPGGKGWSALPRWPQPACPCPAHCPPTTASCSPGREQGPHGCRHQAPYSGSV